MVLDHSSYSPLKNSEEECLPHEVTVDIESVTADKKPDLKNDQDADPESQPLVDDMENPETIDTSDVETGSTHSTGCGESKYEIQPVEAVGLEVSQPPKKVSIGRRMSATWQQLTTVPNTCRNRSFNVLNGEEMESHFCSKLYHTKRKLLQLKNYHDEARAMRDIEKFLEQPIVLFKVHHVLWEEIVEEMIQKVAMEKPELKLDVPATLKTLICGAADYVIPECVQGITETSHGPITEQSFITVIGNTNTVTETQVVMCLLEKSFNFGVGAEEIRFICIVLCPTKGKHTKSAIEVARTYSTLLSDDRLRQNLLHTHSAEEFAHEFELECTRIHKEHEKKEKELNATHQSLKSRLSGGDDEGGCWCLPGKDLANDFRNRASHYLSDFIDDVQDLKSIQKLISTTLFLYFALLLPGIAFGVLDHYYTDGKIDAKNVIVSQALAGLLWTFFSGQPLVVIRTTIPVVIYTKIIYKISLNWDENGEFFYTFYAMTGLSNACFLMLYGLTGVSKIMAFCSRSTDEIVGLFISIAFTVDSVKYIFKEFNKYYCFSDDLDLGKTSSIANMTSGIIKRAAADAPVHDCNTTVPILTLLLVCLTVFVGVQIFNFKYSPYLNEAKRVLVADYAIVVAVAAGTFMKTYVFAGVEMAAFQVNETRSMFQLVDFHDSISATSVGASIGLGFVMSMLFFMEGNISESVVCNPANKLKKGSSFHLDMFVTGVINAILSVFCLPWVHGSLPHSPLHVRALADIEEHIENGHLTEKIVFVRETRLTTLLSHILIGVSIILIPYPLNMIPIPVLYGLFIFLAITSLGEFQMWERLVLIFTEQSLYPPYHYVRRVPQKIIHCFTMIQILQLVALCLISFGGSAYLKMFFPFVIILLMPIREKILPKIISERHLDALDGEH